MLLGQIDTSILTCFAKKGQPVLDTLRPFVYDLTIENLRES
jgi:hypothetical protein